jgi:hypothetical protein
LDSDLYPDPDSLETLDPDTYPDTYLDPDSMNPDPLNTGEALILSPYFTGGKKPGKQVSPC